jgi:Leucine-rich repeat (LRR) protein
MLLLNQEFSNENLSSIETADLRNISKSNWERVLSNCKATELRLYHLTLTNLDGIERLSNTEKLKLDWATKIEDISPVFNLKNLKSLSITDFSKFRDISGIGKLTELTELHLAGNLGSLSPRLQLTSIKPVCEIQNLTSFSLLNARLDDDDITYLTKCKKLLHLGLCNTFDKKQFAYLAKHLNNQLENPITSYREVSLKCSQCNNKKFMFTGRKMPFLCQKCDSMRFNKLNKEFEELVNIS